MKKLLYVLIPLIAVGSYYLIIPSHIKSAKRIAADCSITAANRFVLDTTNWHAWWPFPVVTGDLPDSKGKLEIEKILYNRVKLFKPKYGDSLVCYLSTIALSADTVALEWQIDATLSINPFTRYKQYRQVKDLEKTAPEILNSLQQLLHNREKVYGIKLQRILNGERSLLVLDSTLNYRPGIAEVYKYIAQLRKEITQQGANEINHPMLHISETTEGKYFMMVAVQTDKKTDRRGQMYYKHTYPGYTLVTQVTGGPGAIEQAISKMQLYISDYQVVSPAIAYAEMITDRSKESDTSKWLSRVYYPVF